jgi:adenylate kinase
MSPPPYPYPAALIFGPPGAGKGTQCDILKRVPGFFHLSSGTIFRQLDPASATAATVRDHSLRGELVPDGLTMQIVFDWLEAQRADGRFQPEQHLLLLDGIPRNRQQCALIGPCVDVRIVLHLICRDEQVMMERIRRRANLENRRDDVSDLVIHKRFEVYRRETAPVLEQYPPASIHEVEPTLTPAEVLLTCLQHLVPVYKHSFPRVLPAVA